MNKWLISALAVAATILIGVTFINRADALPGTGVKTVKLLDAVTTTGAGTAKGKLNYSDLTTFQGTVAGTGSVTATILVQGSMDNSNWVTLGTITLSGTTSATDGFVSSSSWGYLRGNVSAVTGTSAAVTLWMGSN